MSTNQKRRARIVSMTIPALDRAIAEQRQWIKEHGDNLAGYLERYGRTDRPDFTRWPGDGFFGNGGHAIFAADAAELTRLVRLRERTRNADGVNTPRIATVDEIRSVIRTLRTDRDSFHRGDIVVRLNELDLVARDAELAAALDALLAENIISWYPGDERNGVETYYQIAPNTIGAQRKIGVAKIESFHGSITGEVSNARLSNGASIRIRVGRNGSGSLAVGSLIAYDEDDAGNRHSPRLATADDRRAAGVR